MQSPPQVQITGARRARQKMDEIHLLPAGGGHQVDLLQFRQFRGLLRHQGLKILICRAQDQVPGKILIPPGPQVVQGQKQAVRLFFLAGRILPGQLLQPGNVRQGILPLSLCPGRRRGDPRQYQHPGQAGPQPPGPVAYLFHSFAPFRPECTMKSRLPQARKILDNPQKPLII